MQFKKLVKAEDFDLNNHNLIVDNFYTELYDYVIKLSRDFNNNAENKNQAISLNDVKNVFDRIIEALDDNKMDVPYFVDEYK